MARFWLLPLFAGLVLPVLPVLGEPAAAQPMGTLKCRGPANFSANATFNWTRGGQPLDPPGPTNFSCTDSTQDGPRSVGAKPREANDWHVKILMMRTLAEEVEQQATAACEGDQTWAPEDPGPKRFRVDCYLPGKGKAIFTIRP